MIAVGDEHRNAVERRCERGFRHPVDDLRASFCHCFHKSFGHSGLGVRELVVHSAYGDRHLVAHREVASMHAVSLVEDDQKHEIDERGEQQVPRVLLLSGALEHRIQRVWMKRSLEDHLEHESARALRLDRAQDVRKLLALDRHAAGGSRTRRCSSPPSHRNTAPELHPLCVPSTLRTHYAFPSSEHTFKGLVDAPIEFSKKIESTAFSSP
jgi:hypothetical protein